MKLVLAAGLLTGASVSVDAKTRQRPFPEGVFGNVVYSDGSGDLAGFEVRFYTDPADGRPMAEFTLCEGWCYEVISSEVTRTDTGFAFSHIETLETYDENGTLTKRDHLVEYNVIPAGRGWKVRLFYDGADVMSGETWRIMPLKRPFGLEVARKAAEEEGGATDQ